ncbi:hypothetical protein BHE74_00032189 [Ensete ventricosum]|uniref:Uncharacterized protein n=1 Tax=Ensete ventricosum TaxID=4639 RepID=A0A427AIL3_ENSVE|nr:hypothetical protein B296_00030557 [Ensete ventricosum]RWW60786.1 hypothetical protein BHE74_00032189 [Ensete ventricosum]RZR96446.1 hypothetical protein BHM03_00025459 [Ensete ventricosum]
MEPLNTKLYEKYKNLKVLLSLSPLIFRLGIFHFVTFLYSFQEQYANCEKSLLEESQKSRLLQKKHGQFKYVWADITCCWIFLKHFAIV